MTNQFARFLLTGGIAALVNIGSRYALNMFMSFSLAVVIAYIFGMITAYTLAKLFVFERSGRSSASEFRRFVAVNMVALIIVWVTSMGLAKLLFPAIRFTWHADDIAHAIGVFMPAITSYLAHRSYTFSKAQDID